MTDIERSGGPVTCDVLIVGGGAIGCATALYLLLEEPALKVTVIEPDPSYQEAASPGGSGGVRQLFSCPENIQLSQYTLDVIDDWQRFASISGETPIDIGWKQRGYLFVARPENVDPLRESLEIQQATGVEALWLDQDDIQKRYPEIRADDLGGAVLSVRDGWHDPLPFLLALQRKAKSLGANFVQDRVSELSVSSHRVQRVHLASGEDLASKFVVNAAGCWAPDLAKSVGMELPVEPMRRFEHSVQTSRSLTHLPFVKDFNDLAVRTADQGLQVGRVNWQEPAGFNLAVDESYFHESVEPILAHRFPGIENMRLRATWAGLYDRNRLDKNMILGNWPGRLDNFYVASGFSGHGLMHAPGVGRALSELIVYGEYRTLDLTRMGYERVLRGEPYREKAIV